jgi:cell division protein FtsQ
MTSTPVSMDPRIRERRVEVQREAGRKRLRVVLVAMSVFVLAGGVYLVIESPALDIDHVRVTGATHVTPDAIQDAAEVPIGAPLLRVDTGAVARRVEALPWVAHAEIARDLPGTLKITVTEHRPAAFVRVPTGGIALVAADGAVIARANEVPTGAVEITGVRRVPPVGSVLSPPGAAGMVQRLPEALAVQVTTVDVSGEGVTLGLARGAQLRLGSLDELDAKAAAALAVLARVGEQPFAYLDVSTPQSPVVGTTPRPSDG